jgi:xyloglucan-specific exo-beta-1,4-glucanase
MALDTQDPNKVYAAVGMYTNSWDPNNGAIVRSSDKGNTWATTVLPFKVGGNMPGRGMGERLAVDPRNSSIIYFGARSGNGLWKSVDGGATFSKVNGFTAPGTYIPNPSDASGYSADTHGLAFVTFDDTSPVVSGATSRIFVGTADNTTASVYVSTDAGATWSAVPNQPGRYFPHKCKLSPAEEALYITYSDGTGPYDGTQGAIYRYHIPTSTWRDITPVSGSDLHYGFGGLGLDMQSPGTLVVASLNSWWPDAQIFRSTDSGATWSPIWEWVGYPDMNWYYGLNTDNAPWINAGFISQDSKRLGWMIEALEIDPTDSDHWLYATGLTLFGGRDLTNWDTKRNVSISVLANGIEEMAVLGLASAPGGSELLAAVGDDSGFTFRAASDVGTSPDTPWMGPMWTTSTDVDYAGNKPERIVRIGNSEGSQQVALSSNGGASWSVHSGAGTAQFGGFVAYSADADTVVWSSSNAGVLRSQNQGAFTAVAFLPSGAVIASDKRNNTVFYAGAGANFYRSTDTGLTFSTVSGALGEAKSVRDAVAHPKVAGEVWVSTDIGLFRSRDFGVTFSRVGVGSLSNTQHISLGVGSGSSWNVYALGQGKAGAKLYASGDDGLTWVDIQGDIQGFGALSACRLVGSANVPGQVYVGTNGRGVFFAKGTVGSGSGTTLVTSSTARPPSTSSAVPTSAVTTTTTVSTTSSRTSTSQPPATTSATAPKLANRWEQCGGNGFQEPTTCAAPWSCKYQNDWYSQCL